MLQIKMFPSKNMVDYMSEMNRLFARNDNHNAYGNLAQSPYNSNNRSSSSAESTSPESLLDSSFRQDFHQRPLHNMTPVYETRDHPTSMCETPKVSEPRRQRPIIGRKILPMENPVRETVATSPKNIPEDYKTFQEDLFHTPPNRNFFIEQKNYTNVLYELFPPELTEFRTPIKTSPVSSKYNLSPTISNVSPTMSSPSFSSLSPRSSQSGPRMFYPRTPMNGPRPANYGHGGQGGSMQRLCSFCRKNGETPVVYMTHVVKERVGNKQVVRCPILRSHVCSTCGATGDNAHTITYCPVLRSTNNGHPLQSTTITLKNTRIKSNGRRRF